MKNTLQQQSILFVHFLSFLYHYSSNQLVPNYATKQFECFVLVMCYISNCYLTCYFVFMKMSLIESYIVLLYIVHQCITCFLHSFIYDLWLTSRLWYKGKHGLLFYTHTSLLRLVASDTILIIQTTNTSYSNSLLRICLTIQGKAHARQFTLL